MAAPGETEIDTPLPTNTPPQLPEYHCQLAPLPKEPPTTESVVELPAQIGFTVALILVGSVDSVLLTFTVTVTQVVELQMPSPLTK